MTSYLRNPHNIFKSKASRNQIVFCDFSKAQNYLGQNWVKSDMPGKVWACLQRE